MRKYSAFKNALFGILSIFASASSVQADTVILHPGTIAGTLSLSGQSIQNMWVYEYSGIYESRGYFNGPSYSLTVEGNNDYHARFDATLATGNTSNTLSISRSQLVSVPVGATVTENINYQTATVEGSIDAIGGVVLGYDLTVFASEPGESYWTRSSRGDGSAASLSFSIPMVVDSSVSVSGTARVKLPDSSTFSVPLDNQTIAFGVNGGTTSWTIDLSATGSIGGTISTIGPDIVNHSTAYLFASGNGNYIGNTSPLADGSYGFQDLVAASYYMYIYTWFDAPYGYLLRPPGATQLAVAPGANTLFDSSLELGFARGTMNISGFFNNGHIGGGEVYVFGLAGTPSHQGSGADYIAPLTGGFDFALSPGDWSMYHTRVLLNQADSKGPINVQLTRAYSQYPTVTLAAGDDAQVFNTAVSTVETQIIFDVAEAFGPEINISSPQISGSSTYQNNPGSFSGWLGFEANGTGGPQPRPAVRIAGEPGVYTVRATAVIDGATVTFARFPLTLPVPVDTLALPNQVGESVSIPPIVLTFTDVTQSGVTAITESPIGPQPPSGFWLATTPPIYYDITTTALFTPPVRVCITYDDSGFALPSDEIDLVLMHYDAELAQWVDLSASVDPGNNTICGDTPSFSVFALMLRDADEDGVMDSSDNCNTVANSDQADFDGDGAGDVCDPDDDGDTVLDADDSCPMTEASVHVDSLGCSSVQRLELACPVAGTYANKGAYMNCIVGEASVQVALGLITPAQKGAIIALAAKSSVGQP